MHRLFWKRFQDKRMWLPYDLVRRIQFWRSEECETDFHCDYSQVHFEQHYCTVFFFFLISELNRSATQSLVLRISSLHFSAKT